MQLDDILREHSPQKLRTYDWIAKKIQLTIKTAKSNMVELVHKTM